MKQLNELISGGEIKTDVNVNQLNCDRMNAQVGNLNEYDGYNCDECKNKGIIYYVTTYPNTDVEYVVTRDCKCKSTRATLRRAKKSGLGNVLSDCTFQKYEATEEWQQQIKQKAQMFCKDDNARWFYIGGQSGAGKTHICTAISGWYLKQGKDCRYMLWRDDAVKLKALVNEYEEYQKLISEFKDVDVLYIDDFLKTQSGQAPTQADINLAFEILNNRVMDKTKITIISSEYPIAEALEFDEATIGRIYQQAGIYKISIDKDMKKNFRLRG